jgi:hypothetical protein
MKSRLERNSQHGEVVKSNIKKNALREYILKSFFKKMLSHMFQIVGRFLYF